MLSTGKTLNLHAYLLIKNIVKYGINTGTSTANFMES